MASESRHVSAFSSASTQAIYAFASHPENIPRWAAGLGGSISLVDGAWVADSPMGRVTVEFTPPNSFGVLDHWVTLPSGERFYNPLRVLADGSGSELVFTLRRADGVSDEDFERDAATIASDLARLIDIVEAS